MRRALRRAPPQAGGRVAGPPARALRRAAAAAVACGICLAGCGDDEPRTTTAAPPSTPAAPATTAEPPTAPAATAGPPPASSTQVERCDADSLTARLDTQPAAAGNRYAVIVLTNTSQGPCRTGGYPGFGLLDADGDELPSEVAWGGPGVPGDPGPSPIVLEPDGAASALMHWGAVPGEDDATTGPCQPEALTLVVTPPDERTPLRVPFGQSVCQGGHIDVTALVAGASGPPVSG